MYNIFPPCTALIAPYRCQDSASCNLYYNYNRELISISTVALVSARVIYSTTHSSSQVEVKSTLVHEVRYYWEATTSNCTVKACPTILVQRKLPVSKEGQQVFDTLNESTVGSKVKGSG